jgi:hypothetical protein
VAKVKVDTTGVETAPSAVKPGLYTVKIKECELRESKAGNPQIAIIMEISGGEFDGRVLFDYIPVDDDSMAWKLASFQDALGINRKATIDTDKIVGKKFKVRTVVQKSEEYGEQARVRNMLALNEKGQSEDLDDDDDDEDVDYEEMSLDELKEEIEAREIEVSGKATKKKLIKLLEENDEKEEDDSDDEDDGDDEAEADDDDESEDGEEDDDDSDDDEDDEDEDYDEMDLAELKKEVKSRKLEVSGKQTKKKLIAALEEDDEEDDDDDDEEDEQDYEEMDLDELKNECKERGLKATGKKAQIIKRLEKDDAEGEDGEPF